MQVPAGPAPHARQGPAAIQVPIHRQNRLLPKAAAPTILAYQAAFFKALTAIDGFRGECQLRVWLCQIARNQYLSLCRERKHFASPAAEAGDEGIEEGFADREAAARLHRLLHALPEPYKEVFSLRTFGELPFAQIAELFGRTESWARVTYFRARQKLKEGFDGT